MELNLEQASSDGPKVSISVLDLINEARNTFGLRTQDYLRYRKYCTAKVHRLRQITGFTHGKGQSFKKQTISPDSVKDDKPLQLFLFEAERAWAYSQELRTASFEKGSSSDKRHGISKLTRAAQWASRLSELTSVLAASGRLDAQSRGEVAVYAALIAGNLVFDRSHHDSALEKLSVARELFGILAECAPTSRSEALANSFIDEVDPMVRFCAYEGRRTGWQEGPEFSARSILEADAGVREKVIPGYAHLVEELKRQAEKQRSAKATTEEARKREQVEICFRGKRIPIRNPELMDVMVRVRELTRQLDEVKGTGKNVPASQKEKRIGQKGMAAYDKLLAALSDAEDVARKLVEDNATALAKAHSARYEAVSKDLNLSHQYIVHQLLSRRIQRDLLIVSDLQRRDEERETRRLATAAKSTPITRKIASPSATSSRHRSTAAAAAISARKLKANQEKAKRRRAKAIPPVVKLLDGVVQSLEQMRELDIVDSDEEIVSRVETNIAEKRGRRCYHLARAYSFSARYPEALTLFSRAALYVREARSALSLADDAAVADSLDDSFHLTSITSLDLDALEADLAREERETKRDWFARNGGTLVSPPLDEQAEEEAKEETRGKKPVFFDIAFNYIDFPTDRIRARSTFPPLPVEEEVAKAETPVKKLTGVARTQFGDKTPRTEAEEKAALVVEEQEEDKAKQAEQQKSSWLGGWFGGRK